MKSVLRTLKRLLANDDHSELVCEGAYPFRNEKSHMESRESNFWRSCGVSTTTFSSLGSWEEGGRQVETEPGVCNTRIFFSLSLWFQFYCYYRDSLRYNVRFQMLIAIGDNWFDLILINVIRKDQISETFRALFLTKDERSGRPFQPISIADSTMTSAKLSPRVLHTRKSGNTKLFRLSGNKKEVKVPIWMEQDFLKKRSHHLSKNYIFFYIKDRIFSSGNESIRVSGQQKEDSRRRLLESSRNGQMASRNETKWANLVGGRG